jgi:nuclease HARBI1
MMTFAVAMYCYALPFFNNPGIFAHCFPIYACLIHNKSNGAATNVWGFIDGTPRRSCQPGEEQRVYYSGHKRNHGIKFQAVVTPDGLVACSYCPVPGSCHDSHLVAQSNLIPLLREVIPPDQPNYALYGDSAYAQCRVLIVGFRYPLPNSCEAQWNTEMSKVRESVEWMFVKFVSLWNFLDVKPKMKIFLSPVHEYYIISTFLTKVHAVIYSNQTADYFGCDETNGRMNIHDYLALVYN